MGLKASSTAMLVVLALAACGGETGPGTTGPGATGPETSEPGAAEALIRIESTGGLVPVDWRIGRGPVYTLTSDGRLISEGATIAIFPGPLLPFYMVTEVSDGEMRQIRSMIDRMGLAGMVDEVDDTNASRLADATTEVITYWDANGTHRYLVYGLGLGMGQVSEPNRVFEELRGVLDTLAHNRDTVEYQPERIRVFAGEGTVDRDFTDLRDWPLPDTDLSAWADLGDGWQCKAFDPDILETLRDATQVTVWRSPDPGGGPAELKLLVRGLHPGEEDCPGPLS